MATNPYLAQLQALLPPGAAWPRDREATLTKLLEAVADELAKVNGRADRLVAEADPRSTLELLVDWERVAGLPDSCTGGAATLQERRDELVARLTAVGGQSPGYYIGVAATVGYAIAIEEFKPFVAGIGQCSVDTLNGGHAVRFHWRVAVPDPRLTYFRTGESQAGDKLLAVDRAEDLECLLSRLKPAHGNLVFNYTGV